MVSIPIPPRRPPRVARPDTESVMTSLRRPLPGGGLASEAAPRGLPLLRLGFRPFYLGAAGFGAIAVPAWVALLDDALPAPAAMPALAWHAHEMLFGFAVAVIVGFLLTAVRNWTGLATPRGLPLGLLAALWLAARVAAPLAPYPLYAALDAALLPIVAAVVIRLLHRARSGRNAPIGAILVLLAIANASFHLAVLGHLDIDPMRALHAGLALVVAIETVIGGRVIPNFTVNAAPGLRQRVRPRLETAAFAATGLALALWVFAPPGPLAALAFASAALLQAARQAGWHPFATGGRPILQVLHLAYAWIPVGFVLMAAAQAGLVSPSAGIHALGVGATGGLIIGMITRTARGHTGRPLQASAPETAAYALVAVAALLRVGVPLVAPGEAGLAYVAAAIAWSAAFLLYLGVFAGWLLAPRADGRDG